MLSIERKVNETLNMKDIRIGYFDTPNLLLTDTETYSELYQISRMEHFAKNVNRIKALTFFAKPSIADIDRVLNILLKYIFFLQ